MTDLQTVIVEAIEAYKHNNPDTGLTEVTVALDQVKDAMVASFIRSCWR